MKSQYTLPLDDQDATLELVGGKGASLARLVRAGLPVPSGFHVTTEAYRLYVDTNALQSAIMAALEAIDLSNPLTLQTASQTIHDLFMRGEIPKTLAETIVAGYAHLPGDSPAVAVRSSATAEDLPEASFAGQQESYLNIVGADAVLEATRKCWASLWTARAIGYRARQEIDSQGVALAVVVQLLVPAEAAGIMFTANPLNGQRGETVINAAWGLGEAIVGGQVTPDTFTVEKSSGAVISREVASKLIQTAPTDSGVEQLPVPEYLQNLPTLSDTQAMDLARYGAQIEKIYGMPMDIEWTWTSPSPPTPLPQGEGGFAIVQARPITALPEPPIEWALPDSKGTYMRGSVVDLMPAPLSPLFVTLGIETLKEQMKPLGKRLTRIEPNMADDYFTAINHYAYMNARIPAKTWKWILFGLLPSYPRIFRTMVPLWRDELHPNYQAFAAGLRDWSPGEMTAVELWRGAQEILDAAMYYVCGLMFATMGASAGSEMMLTKVYEKVARQEGDPPGTALLMGWDNIPVRAEKSLYDLAMWVREHDELAKHVLETSTLELAERLSSSPLSPLPVGKEMGMREWDELVSRFQAHLDLFGHMVFQLDFAEDLPRDHPGPMLETIKMYLRGEGVNPHERQRASEELRIQTAEMMLTRLKGFKRWAFTKALKWGQSMAEVREDALADIGLGYPMLRALLLELGERFVEIGVIEQSGDIFLLEKDEIEALVRGDRRQLAALVSERKALLQRLKLETAPPMMPVKERIMGIKTDVFVPHAAEAQAGNTLKGVAASAGTVTAPACVLHGPEDFAQMRPGDILVTNTTTPAWTPLFSLAAAVVTDIGGPLSHGSIVAREFGIPAVMGTGVATKRIQSGQIITVDGNQGSVKLHNGE